jgi:hypothetical protein
MALIFLLISSSNILLILKPPLGGLGVKAKGEEKIISFAMNFLFTSTWTQLLAVSDRQETFILEIISVL